MSGQTSVSRPAESPERPNILELPVSLRGRVDILACPGCRGRLTGFDGALACLKCGRRYPVKNHKIYFMEPPAYTTAASNLKHRLRGMLGSHYKRAVRLFGPGLPRNAKKLLLQYIDPRENCVVDLGAGVERIHPNVLTVDLFDYPEVDIICDLRTLPFADENVDAFLTSSVLEHIENGSALVDDMYRCTRAGGVGIHSVPFLFPFHEAPYDFVRYTHVGLRSLFGNWQVLRLYNAAGPITLANTVAVEFFSTLLSFRINRLKEFLYLFLGFIASPLKLLDIIFINRDSFLSVSAILCIVVKKPRNI
jgi:SAM-dependent methyltransferase